MPLRRVRRRRPPHMQASAHPPRTRHTAVALNSHQRHQPLGSPPSHLAATTPSKSQRHQITLVQTFSTATLSASLDRPCPARHATAATHLRSSVVRPVRSSSGVASAVAPSGLSSFQLQPAAAAAVAGSAQVACASLGSGDRCNAGRRSTIPHLGLTVQTASTRIPHPRPALKRVCIINLHASCPGRGVAAVIEYWVSCCVLPEQHTL